MLHLGAHALLNRGLDQHQLHLAQPSMGKRAPPAQSVETSFWAGCSRGEPPLRVTEGCMHLHCRRTRSVSASPTLGTSGSPLALARLNPSTSV